MTYPVRRARLLLARSRSTHTEEEWRDLLARVLEATGGCCPRCACYFGVGQGGMVQKDHVRPLHLADKDGLVTDGVENLQPLCAACNAEKGSETIDWLAEWEAEGWAEGLRGGVA